MVISVLVMQSVDEQERSWLEYKEQTEIEPIEQEKQSPKKEEIWQGAGISPLRAVGELVGSQ